MSGVAGRAGAISLAAITAAAAVWPLAAKAQQAADRAPLYVSWEIQPAETVPGPQAYAGGDFVFRQKLLPAGLAELREPISDAKLKLDLPAGAQLVAVGPPENGLFCDATRYRKKANDTVLKCFADRDNDGRFEGYFRGFSESGAIISLTGSLKLSKLKPVAPASYARIDRAAFAQDLFVGIQRRNFFNIYGRESFMIVYGNAAHTEEITQPIQFKATEMPHAMTVMGARLTALSESEGKMMVEVQQVMPRQPFSIIRTTTYSFY